MTPHEVAALRLLAEAEPAMRGRSDRMLAAAQVHATLAVEAAVRELIAVMAPPPDGDKVTIDVDWLRRNVPGDWTENPDGTFRLRTP
jgi:hypothetical protein